MSLQYQNRKRLLLSGILFMMMFFSITVCAEAGWNGRVGERTYTTAAGQLLKDTWFKKSGRMYFAGEDGLVYSDGIYEINGYSYLFNKKGIRLTGKRTFEGNTYYFNKKSGRMQKNKWIKTGGKYYYCGEDGVILKNTWIDRYYVGKKGYRLKKRWQGSRYLMSSGKAAIGLKKISGDYYYFDEETYDKVTDTQLTINGKTYQFDSEGKGSEVTNNGAPKASVPVEQTYYTDPLVDDEDLLSAIIYCEAGNQGYTGQLAVGLVIFNRVNAKGFPSKLREVVYQSNQFTPARNGALTKALTGDLATNTCRKAAADLITKLEVYEEGTPVYIKIEDEKEVFPYLFFMTNAAFSRYHLATSYKQIGAHVFFQSWK